MLPHKVAMFQHNSVNRHMDATIRFSIIDRQLVYMPAEPLVCKYELQLATPDDIHAVEASVLWYTEGKGGEDMAVHFFERRVREDVLDKDLRRPHRFETTLPNSPLSYFGAIVRICWCARLRVFLRNGEASVEQIPFQLGDVPRQRIRERSPVAKDVFSRMPANPQ